MVAERKGNQQRARYETITLGGWGVWCCHLYYKSDCRDDATVFVTAGRSLRSSG